MSRRVIVRVPGATAISPDPEIAAVAIDRWLDASIITTNAESGAVVERGGTFASLRTPAAEDPLVVAFRAACERAGREVPGGLHVRVVSRIPIAHGLGASAAAVVAGVVAADALLDLRLGEDVVQHVAADVHGRESQVGAVLHGGAWPALTARSVTQSLIVATVDGSVAIHDGGEELALVAGALRATVLARRTILALAATEDATCVAARLEAALRIYGARAEVFVNPARVRGHERTVRHVCDDDLQPHAAAVAFRR